MKNNKAKQLIENALTSLTESLERSQSADRTLAPTLQYEATTQLPAVPTAGTGGNSTDNQLDKNYDGTNLTCSTTTGGRPLGHQILPDTLSGQSLIQLLFDNHC